jgi:hypothetical protein
MAKYDDIFANSEEFTEEELEPEEAIAAIATLALLVRDDAEVSPDLLLDVLTQFDAFARSGDEKLLELVDRMTAIGTEDGLGALFNAADEVLPDESIPDAFAAAAMVLMDNGESALSATGKEFLKELQDNFDVDDDEAAEILAEIGAGEDRRDIALPATDDGEGMEETYVASDRSFQLPLPVDAERGGTYTEKEGSVTFSDDFGALYRIDRSPIPPESQGTERFSVVKSALMDRYIPEAIVANLPAAKVLYEELLEDELDGAYFAMVEMPGGSTVDVGEEDGDSERLDAYRGLLSFIVGDRLYILSTQRNLFADEEPDETTTEAEDLIDTLLAFADSIEFDE